MHKKRFFALVVFLLLLPVLAWADKLEVRRPANVYAEPNRQSEVLARLDPSEKEGPYLINLLDSEKVNGYYHVRVPGKSKKDGFIRPMCGATKDSILPIRLISGQCINTG